jgi:hypothetical protein
LVSCWIGWTAASDHASCSFSTMWCAPCHVLGLPTGPRWLTFSCRDQNLHEYGWGDRQNWREQERCAISCGGGGCHWSSGQSEEEGLRMGCGRNWSSACTGLSSKWKKVDRLTTPRLLLFSLLWTWPMSGSQSCYLSDGLVCAAVDKRLHTAAQASRGAGVDCVFGI